MSAKLITFVWCHQLLRTIQIYVDGEYVVRICLRWNYSGATWSLYSDNESFYGNSICAAVDHLRRKLGDRYAKAFADAS